VPVHVADNLTPAQVKAYRLMDNRSHQETDWDPDVLGAELEDLRDLNFDLLALHALAHLFHALERVELLLLTQFLVDPLRLSPAGGCVLSPD
jgi:hypothetical protein